MKINELRNEIVDYFKKNFYLVHEEDYLFLANYVLLCWTFKRFQEIPYVVLLGDPGSGKTVLGNLILNLIQSKQNYFLSEQAVFQKNTKYPQGWFFDELDFLYSESRINLKIFLSIGNCANSWFMPVYPREDGNFELGEIANAYSPKIFASNHGKCKTLCQISIMIYMPVISIQELAKKEIPACISINSIVTSGEIQEQISKWVEEFHKNTTVLSPIFTEKFKNFDSNIQLLMAEITALEHEEEKVLKG